MSTRQEADEDVNDKFEYQRLASDAKGIAAFLNRVILPHVVLEYNGNHAHLTAEGHFGIGLQHACFRALC